MRAVIGAVVMAVPAAAGAQRPGQGVEVFTTLGGIVGTTPLRIDGAARVALHEGFRFDAGIQGERLAIALGSRVWKLSPSSVAGGGGVDLFFTAEQRVGSGTRTTVRASVGGNIDGINGGHGPPREGTGTSGMLWSVGAAREFIAPLGIGFILSADIVVPHVDTQEDGRRRPILELGGGFRLRSDILVDAIPSLRPSHSSQ